MTKYMLIHTLGELPSRSPAFFEEKVLPRVEAWRTEMEERGVLLDGAAVAGVELATTVRNREPGGGVHPGPFARTQDQIAGVDLIEAQDLDQAVAVAAAHPTMQAGAIEIRPFAPGMPTPIPTPRRRDNQRYLMLVCWDQSGDPEILPTADAPEDSEISEWLDMCGERRLHGWQLQPPALARTVREVDGSVVMTDGPFAETREQIGGYDLLECGDLDEAIAIASSHPASTLDLRPVVD